MTPYAPRNHLLLAALTVGAFAIGLDTFVAIGALDEIIRDMSVSLSAGGWIVSSYAFAYALFTPLNAWLFRRWNPRNVLVMSLAFFVVGNLTCAVATDFSMLIGARMLCAFGAAMFTPAATLLATKLLPQERKGFALSLIFGGMTVSQAAGVPVTSWVAEQFGWRSAFHFVVFFGLVAMVLLALLLASLPTVQAHGTSEKQQSPLPCAVYGLLTVTLLIVTAEFAVYAYVSVLVSHTQLAGVSVLPVLLMAYGLGAVAGNAATGILTDRIGPTAVLVWAVACQTALLVALIVFRQHGLTVVLVGFMWGIVSYMYLVPIQHRLLSHAPERSAFVLAVNSSLIYIGIGVGSWTGGLALERIGEDALAWITAGIGLLALAVSVRFMRRSVKERARSPGAGIQAGTSRDGR